MANGTDKEVIIIGGGLGGLSAGIHLRLAGFRVALFEANERVGGRANRIERDGFRFDTGPSLLNYPWVFEQMFERAGRKMSDYVELVAVDPSITFRWNDGETLQLSSDLRKFLSECERLEPGCAPGVFAFLRESETKYRLAFEKLINQNVDNPVKWLGALSMKELWQTSIHRTLDAELKRYFKSRYLREALGSYGMYLGGSPFNLPGMFSILSYGELAYGLWLPKNGIYGLVEGIERLASELGVEIHTNCPVKKIRVDEGKVEGVELVSGEFHPASLVVSNVDVPTTDAELIEIDENSEKQNRRSKKIKMTPGVITFYWGVRGKIENLGHHTIFLPDDYRAAFDDLFKHKRIPRNLPFYVSVPSETDKTLAPAGDTCVFVLVPTPLLSEMPGAEWDEITAQVKAKVFTGLTHHGVRLAPERIAVEEVYTPADWRRRFALYDGSAFGAAHTLFQLGPFRRRNYSRQIEGLYYTGASTTPGTGMPMVVLSGQLVAERIVSHVR
jgi:phytoene desaturase